MLEGKIPKPDSTHSETGGELAWQSGRMPERDFIHPEQVRREEAEAGREAKRRSRVSPPGNPESRRPLGHPLRQEFIETYLHGPKLLPDSVFPEIRSRNERPAPHPRVKRRSR